MLQLFILDKKKEGDEMRREGYAVCKKDTLLFLN